MDNDLVCNYRKCRKKLTDHAWVTSCSHIFCEEDGNREFNKAYTCPACEKNLSGKFDIIRVDLQPSVQYRSIILTGQRPEVIMEICSRAMDFWTYQMHQERMYQEYQANKAREKTTKLEQYFEQLVNSAQVELNSLKSQLSGTKKELENLKKKYLEASEKIMEKNRQYQKLQTMYDAMRRKCITPASFGEESQSFNAPRGLNSFQIPLVTGEDLKRPGSTSDVTKVSSPPEREFALRPVTTPIMGTVSDHAIMANPLRLDLNGSAKRIGSGGNRRR